MPRGTPMKDNQSKRSRIEGRAPTMGLIFGVPGLNQTVIIFSEKARKFTYFEAEERLPLS
jgi:hypothetical protein